MKVRLGIAIRRGKNKNPTKPQIRRIAHAFCAQGVLNSKASVDGGRKMAAVILESLGALWVQNLRGKLALGLFSSHSILPQSHIHTSASLEISRKWEKKNKIVYPPQLPGEPRRPAEIYHCRRQIKYSKDKMWYLAKLIRGMSIDQALAQLEFSDKKGAQIIKEVLLEAQDMAVRDHNVEFRSNLYIAESTSGRGQYLKRIRYHGRGRFGIMEKVFCHYFVKLVEGPPPPPEAPKTAVTHAKEYIQELRNRTIIHAL
ncbi:large ribosomal subunit protein uL22m isoform X2 [Odocoileus virginianus]|uniref:Large ribosomal subunit protein uL22m n=4 Tax=Cervidae TaxID=9850 RepID=A0A6J0YJK9_ODOVR|nr:39S ribosomal protein L22, mitochondrial isoform X1 [Odocoileus virginianus texanus]